MGNLNIVLHKCALILVIRQSFATFIGSEDKEGVHTMIQKLNEVT